MPEPTPVPLTRPLGGIVAGSVVTVAVLCSGLALVVLLLWPSEISGVGLFLRFAIPSFGALALAYFSIAYLVVRKSTRQWKALMVGAVLTGVVSALWMSAGISGLEQSEIWRTALVMAVVLSGSLLLGSATLYRMLGSVDRVE